ncbi:hypothetical protein QOZ88_05530 [Blastococcus sp. BMG 814]|uniref:Uncharacterized protein n=1 Tax=Blastococcus carthaginiensis TaxID=3050034 RepID=A0ABT9I939_9ACTN|nr:hypothetical protein [Blastococcus carthaginiensis]MDP5182091.1 hypothetical protein [Blastococcus carthaginiensis]
MALLRTVDAPARSWRSVAVLTACVVVAAAPYLAGVLIPYYVNGLDALPLAEVASGAHDPKDLWPQGTVGGLAQLGGYLSLALTPIALLAVGGTSAAAVVQEWHTLPAARRAPRPVAAAFVVLFLVCVILLAWFFTPTASALSTWRMD